MCPACGDMVARNFWWCIKCWMYRENHLHKLSVDGCNPTCYACFTESRKFYSILGITRNLTN